MRAEFKIIGLNRRGLNLGVYATVEIGREDWFHADIDPDFMTAQKQYELFDYFKSDTGNPWTGANIRAVVQFDKYSSGNMPVNPVIVEIKNIP